MSTSQQSSAKIPRVHHDRHPKPPYPEQKQHRPGLEQDIRPHPRYQAPEYRPAGKLRGKVALITGGDSGIGRSVAVLYAREGADVAVSYLPAEEADAQTVRAAVEHEGRRCLLLPGDLTHASFCRDIISRTVAEFGTLDILVSNAAHQGRTADILDLSDEQFDRTYRTNVYAFFRLVKAALPHLHPEAAIIATASVQGQDPSKDLVDYASTKAAIISMVKSLAKNLVVKGIRVNAVAPGPVWTPLNVVDPGASPQKVSQFGAKSPAGRPAQPEEIAPAYVFLASHADSSFVSGEILFETMGE